LSAFVFLFGTFACINEDKSVCPPDYGKVRLSTLWALRSAEAEIPRSYTFRTDEYADSGLSPSAEPILLTHKFPGGFYQIHIYNAADSIRVNGETAQASAHNGWVTPTPGWFFSYSDSLELINGVICDLQAQMRQQTRLLTLELTAMGEAGERIKSLDATISGVASELNIGDGSVGKPAGVAFHLASFPGNIRQASARLLGMTEETHWLTLTALIRAADGVSEELVKYEIDATRFLDGFNMDKHYPMTLQGKIYLERDDNDPLLLKIIVRDWNVVYGETISAE
jgi:hypothetical protein